MSGLINVLGFISRKTQPTHLLPRSFSNVISSATSNPSQRTSIKFFPPFYSSTINHRLPSPLLYPPLSNPPSTSISDGPSRDALTPVPWLRDPRPPPRLPSADAFVLICKFAPLRVLLSWGGGKAGQPVNVMKTGLSGFDGCG